MFTRDYNLSGQNNVYLSFHSIYVQNQNRLGSVEYSINGGATWLPALYMLDGPDILRDAQGHIDASNTFAFVHTDVPVPGNYGAFIGVAQNQWANLGPFLSARVNDDLVESKRVELIRLAQADNQATVRVRFAQEGLSVTIDSEGGTFTMQGIDLGSAAYTGATTATIDTTANATAVLTAVKAAMDQLSQDRAAVGAYQSRLNYSADQLTISRENLSAASSRIQDVDVAQESTQYARYNILVQAGTAMLAQANQVPQTVLKLLQ